MPNVILHAGTPKTGTTSLQWYLYRHREALARQGILYPEPEAAARWKPKHGWVRRELADPAAGTFRERTDALLARPDVETVILSDENLFMRWWGFSPMGRAALTAFAGRAPITVALWFREPQDFARALYLQALKNPYVPHTPNGTAASLEAMLEHQWFVRPLDYRAYLEDVERLLGPGTVRAFAYRGDTVREFSGAFKLPELAGVETRENVSLGSLGATVLRDVNSSRLPARSKLRAVELITELDHLAGAESAPLVLSDAARARIDVLSRPGVAYLADRYGIEFGVSGGERSRRPEPDRVIACAAWNDARVRAYAARLAAGELTGYAVVVVTDLSTDVSALASEVTVVRHAYRAPAYLRQLESLSAFIDDERTILCLDPDSPPIDDVALGFTMADRHGIALAPRRPGTLTDEAEFAALIRRAGVEPRGRLTYDTRAMFLAPSQPEIQALLFRALRLAAAGFDRRWGDDPYVTAALELGGIVPYPLAWTDPR